MSVSKWRMRCETENTYVYTWSDTVPTVCPNGGDHTIDQNSTVGISQVQENTVKVRNLPMSPFNRLLTSEETVLLSLKPGMGVSKLRDIVETEGSGSVINITNNPEYIFNSPGGSVSTLRTAERCRYMPGLASEIGIGGHLEQGLTGEQTLKFGIFDESNGFYFDIRSDDLYVVIRKDGIDVETVRTEFNLDQVDGSGSSGVFLNYLKGYIWTIRFSWYGYGSVDFCIVTENNQQEQTTIVMHRYFPQTRPSTSVPNLPITVTLTSGENDPACVAYVTGRKYSVLGKFEPMTRRGSVQRILTSSESGWVPVLSLARKPGYLSAPVAMNQVDVFGTTGMTVYKVCTGTTLTGPVWSSPDTYMVDETAMLYDETATSATEGITIWKGIARNDAVMASIDNNLDFYLTETDIVTLFILNPDTIGQTAISIRWTEEW